jgi:hypothetical protein
MEHPTALPERQTLACVVTEADSSSLNRYRPKIVVTSVELEAEAREIGISGEFLSVRYTREIFTEENRRSDTFIFFGSMFITYIILLA